MNLIKQLQRGRVNTKTQKKSFHYLFSAVKYSGRILQKTEKSNITKIEAVDWTCFCGCKSRQKVENFFWDYLLLLRIKLDWISTSWKCTTPDDNDDLRVSYTNEEFLSGHNNSVPGIYGTETTDYVAIRLRRTWKKLYNIKCTFILLLVFPTHGNPILKETIFLNEYTGATESLTRKMVPHV